VGRAGEGILGLIKSVLAAQTVLLGALVILAADVYAHKRVEGVGGVNIWGYRGPVAKQRAPDEYRILFVGGTRAYGYGAAADGTIAYALGWELTGDTRRPVNVINAAAMGATAPDYAAIVSRYQALAADLVCIYDDLGLASTRRRESRIARLTGGYTPVLPLVLEEKGMAWRYGSVARGYAGEPPTTAWPKRMAGFTLQWIGSSLKSVESTTVSREPADYAAAIFAAADVALARATRVMVVVDPPVDGSTRNNLIALQQALALRGESGLSLLMLSDVGQPDTLLDGYSYNAVGRSRVAQAMRVEVRKLVK
jgi:hypothetical protein